MGTLKELRRVVDEATKSYKYVQIALTMLLTKEYRCKSKMYHVEPNATIMCDEHFKISEVTARSLENLQFQLQLQSKNEQGKEVCVGETLVDLAKLMRISGKFETWVKLN